MASRLSAAGPDEGVAAAVVCDAAKPHPDNFLVNGEPFGWYISADGPKAFQLAGPGLLDGARTEGLYAVRVTIVEAKPFSALGLDLGQLCIGGREFPWHVMDTGVLFSASLRDAASVTLEFPARRVEGIPFVYRCTYCSQDRPTVDAINAHTLVEHSDDDGVAHCRVCGCRFTAATAGQHRHQDGQ